MTIGWLAYMLGWLGGCPDKAVLIRRPQAAAGDATGRGENAANAGFNSQTAPRSVIILFDTRS